MGCGPSAVSSTQAIVPKKPSEPAVVNDKPSEATQKQVAESNGLKEPDSKLDAVDLPGSVQKPTSAKASAPSLDWEAADIIATGCPLHIRKTVEHLTSYFKEHTSGILLARTIFRWITSHMIWRAGGSQEPDSVLRKGGGEDKGFAGLFATMCNACGLEAYIAEGHVKDTSYIPGTMPDTTSYWNMLQVDEEQYIVDCCRAAGFVKSGDFEPMFNGYYWLPAPSSAIYTHYPLDSKYQGCETVYTKEDWIALPKTTSLYFKYDCDADNLTSVYRADKDGLLQINLTVPPQCVCRTEIIRQSPKQKLPHSYSYVAQEAEKCVIYSGYPHPGQYILRVLLKERSDSVSEMKLAVEYGVRVSTGHGTDPLYPVNVDTVKEFTLVGPLLGELARDLPAYFHCKVKGASQVSVLVGEDICPLKRISDNRTVLSKLAKVSTQPIPSIVEDFVQDDAEGDGTPPNVEETPAEAETDTPSAPTVTEAPATVTETPETVTETPATVTETPANVTESPETLAETPTTVTETPTTVTETLAETPTTVTETPATVAETPETVTETPATVTETSPSEESPQAEEGRPPAAGEHVTRESQADIPTPSASVAISESDVTTVWAGEVAVKGREVFLAAFYPDSDSMDYTHLVKFNTKVI